MGPFIIPTGHVVLSDYFLLLGGDVVVTCGDYNSADDADTETD